MAFSMWSIGRRHAAKRVGRQTNGRVSRPAHRTGRRIASLPLSAIEKGALVAWCADVKMPLKFEYRRLVCRYISLSKLAVRLSTTGLFCWRWRWLSMACCGLRSGSLICRYRTPATVRLRQGLAKPCSKAVNPALGRVSGAG